MGRLLVGSVHLVEVIGVVIWFVSYVALGLAVGLTAVEWLTGFAPGRTA